MGMKQKEIILERKVQNGQLQKLSFSKSPILKIFLRKFYRLVIGLVELTNAKGIGLAQFGRPCLYLQRILF